MTINTKRKAKWPSIGEINLTLVNSWTSALHFPQVGRAEFVQPAVASAALFLASFGRGHAASGDGPQREICCVATYPSLALDEPLIRRKTETFSGRSSEKCPRTMNMTTFSRVRTRPPWNHAWGCSLWKAGQLLLTVVPRGGVEPEAFGAAWAHRGGVSW